MRLTQGSAVSVQAASWNTAQAASTQMAELLGQKVESRNASGISGGLWQSPSMAAIDGGGIAELSS
jgi:hypothetical protein